MALSTSQRIREAADLAAQTEADAAAFERDGAVPPPVAVLSPGYVRAVHPDHGEAVVFTPGELLPDWAAAAIAGLQPDDAGVIDVTEGA